MVYSHSYNGYTDAENRYIELQTNYLIVVNDSRMMNNTASTTDFQCSVYVLITQQMVILRRTYIYCWSEIPGYSKFGSYVGNGNANGCVFGFQTCLIIIKRAWASEDWVIADFQKKFNDGGGRRTQVYAYVSGKVVAEGTESHI